MRDTTGILARISALKVAAARVLENYLFGVEPTDAATFTLVSLLLLAVCLAASHVPARRAARADPMAALLCE